MDSNNLLRAQFLQEAWEGIGVNVEVQQVRAVGVHHLRADRQRPTSAPFGWRQHAGIFVDTQNYWWNGERRPGTTPSLNFSRLNDPVINELLTSSGVSEPMPLGRALAEDINRQFAKECWILPLWFTRWGIIHNTSVEGIGTSPQASRYGHPCDGAGFPGQVWLQGVFKAS